ncbi:OB-fold nucleic acid binding domain-containing protein [Haloferax sp. Atlit-4N]|uniref:OB-fold nucleic acid binding domain-containing protein n=1 Tax=Haloferax sp. Atlit-4N TaxID=2077206 RepID=UPI001F2C9129|nr:OB-fold nucleic acid binding domain-containing protein [Haloferax sp. Atlit-4N]
MSPPRPSATGFVRRSRTDAATREAAGRAPTALGHRLVNRLRARARRRLVDATPKRRIRDLDGVARATVVGTVAGIAGDGLAVERWVDRENTDGDQRGGGGRTVVGRATRPFVLRDATGEIRVRVPPDGHVVFGGDGECGVVARGDEVAVTGRVARDRGGRRLLTGPRFVVRADAT